MQQKKISLELRLKIYNYLKYKWMFFSTSKEEEKQIFNEISDSLQ